MQEDNSYSAKMPSGLARLSIHPFLPSFLLLPSYSHRSHPAKLNISVIVSKKTARLQLWGGKETSHQGWERNKTAWRQQTQGHATHPKKSKVHGTQQRDRRKCLQISAKFSQMLLSYTGIPWSGRICGSSQMQVPNFSHRIKQQVQFNLPSSNAAQGCAGNTEDPAEFGKGDKEIGRILRQDQSIGIYFVPRRT